MLASLQAGRALFALGMALLGAFCLAFADFLMEWTALPEAFPGRAALAYANGVFLVGAAAALMWRRTLRIGALALAGLWLAYTAPHVPNALADWRAGVGVLSESLALACVGLMLADAATGDGAGPLARAGRYGFGLCLPVFGLVHFLYPTIVADWVPDWIPGPGLFWAYFTGACHLGAGLAVLSGVLARLASRLLGVMFTSWLLIVHAPRVAAALTDRHEWTVLFVAMAMSGGAWALAGVIARMATKAAPTK